MKTERIIILGLIAILGLFSCGTSTKNESKPSIPLAQEFGIDSIQLVY